MLIEVLPDAGFQEMEMRATQHERSSRTGVATLWVILSLLIAVCMICITIEIGNLWIARLELESAVEAAALGAVDHWGDAGGGNMTLAARNRGVVMAGANTVSGTSVPILTNYNMSAINGNASCDGNLVFGSVSVLAPRAFDHNGSAGCAPPATVFIEIDKSSAGADVTSDEILVRFDAADPSLEIRTLRFTLPLDSRRSQTPYFNSDKAPEVSQVAGDFDGLNPDPRSAGPLTGTWWCSAPPSFAGGGFSNPDGDICFEMDDQLPPGGPIGTNRFRTLVIEFRPGAFTEDDFFHFGVSTNQLNPPVLPPGVSNDGDAWHVAPVKVEVTFYDNATMQLSTFETDFVDDGDPSNGIAQANLTGGGGGIPAVFAQATVEVRPLCAQIVGFTSFNVSASTYAQYDCATGHPSLIWVEQTTCP